VTRGVTSVMHIVLVRWNSLVSEKQLHELTDLVSDLPEVIPGLLEVRSGPSSSTEGLEGGFEWALFVHFETSAARDVYVIHPRHEPVKTFIGEWAAEVVVFDIGD
jgi:Stress responsive A/B Barrel Domain